MPAYGATFRVAVEVREAASRHAGCAVDKLPAWPLRRLSRRASTIIGLEWEGGGPTTLVIFNIPPIVVANGVGVAFQTIRNPTLRI